MPASSRPPLQIYAVDHIQAVARHHFRSDDACIAMPCTARRMHIHKWRNELKDSQAGLRNGEGREINSLWRKDSRAESIERGMLIASL